MRPTVLPEASPARTMTDANGVKVHVPLPNRGTVMGAPFLAEYLLVTNDANSIFSIDKFNFESARNGPLGRIYTQVLSKRTDLAEGDLNPERLLLAQPGAVIPWGPAPEALKAAGLPVVELNTMWVEGWWFDNARVFGDLDGQPNRGRELKRHYYEAIRNLQAELPPGKIGARPTVLEVSPGRDGTLRNTGVSGHQDQFQTLAGGLNAIQFNSMPERIDIRPVKVFGIAAVRTSGLSQRDLAHTVARTIAERRLRGFRPY
jgi:ABC-type Fe3+-hydroxamate transport system substrate-binding protein